MKEKITALITDSIEAKKKLLSGDQVATIARVAQAVIDAYRNCKKVLVFGNGGSAGDAQHLAAELVVRFEKNRMALPALALTTDSSILTSVGNDFSFNDIFKRQVEALAVKGDVVIGISTSGNSPNVISAIAQAKAQGATTIVFTGAAGGKLKGVADVAFAAPSDVTARIQECHILAIHVICTLIEEELFSDK